MKNENEALGPKYKLIIDSRTAIYIKTEEALKKWLGQYPKAEVVKLNTDSHLG